MYNVSYVFSYMYYVIYLFINCQYFLRWMRKICWPMFCCSCGDNHSSSEFMRAKGYVLPRNNSKLGIPPFAGPHILLSLSSVIFPGSVVDCAIFVVVIIVLLLMDLIRFSKQNGVPYWSLGFGNLSSFPEIKFKTKLLL